MNLDRRTDRWEQVTQDTKVFREMTGIEVERVAAIEDKERPEAGTFATLRKIVKMAKDTNMEYVLVLEDDLFVISVQKVIDCLNDAPEDWDILSGGSYYYVPKKEYNQHWMEMTNFCSLHFAIIRNTAYDKILKPQRKVHHVDRYLGDECKEGRLKVYLMHPMPCQQRSGFSDLRNRHVNDNKLKGLPWYRN